MFIVKLFESTIFYAQILSVSIEFSYRTGIGMRIEGYERPLTQGKAPSPGCDAASCQQYDDHVRHVLYRISSTASLRRAAPNGLYMKGRSLSAKNFM